MSQTNPALIYEDRLPGGTHWSLTLKRGTVLRLTDIEGGANVGMLFYNPVNLLERYNAPDTLKCQHTFKLTRGHCLYSDMGRIFCSVIDDQSGWHDTVCGSTTRKMTDEKWGLKTYQDHRNGWTLNGHDSFLVEGAKYGLNKKDLAANVNWFTKVEVDGEGAMHFDPNHAAAGASVDLRFEMDTLVLMHTCPHPLNPASDYPRKPVLYQLFKGAAVPEDDPCKTHCPENERGFANTRLFNLTA